MDELKLKLSTHFMRSIIANFIRKTLCKKLGCNVDILLNEIDIKHDGTMMKVHVDVDAKMTTSEFEKILKSICKD